MRIIHNLEEMTETARGWLAGGSVGFVPTMRYLHEGHITLVQAARQECEISVASIFVNPMQFEESDVLIRYPRDLSRDLQLLSSTNVDVVFILGKYILLTILSGAVERIGTCEALFRASFLVKI